MSLVVYALHSSISSRLADFMRSLLPEDDEASEDWRDLVPHDIEHAHDDPSAAKEWNEERWLRTMKSKQRIVVLCMGKRNHAIEALQKEGQLRFVNLPATYTQMNHFQQAHFLTGAWSAIVAKTHKAKPGQGFKVTAQYKVEPL